MKKIMTYETLRNFTYSNDNLIEGRIKGVVLNFMGLNFNWMIENSAEGSEYAERGILYVIPSSGLAQRMESSNRIYSSVISVILPTMVF